MNPKIKKITNLRHNRVVKTVAVGTIGAVVAYKLAKTQGFDLVRPYTLREDGTQVMQTITGQLRDIVYQD